MHWLFGLALAGLAVAPSAAASHDHLDRLLAGKAAAPPQRCIFPDYSAQPEIIDHTAIVYFDARSTYVAHLKGGCPALREDRRIAVHGIGGRLCANDPVHISEPTGHDFGFCTFASFTPYRKR